MRPPRERVERAEKAVVGDARRTRIVDRHRRIGGQRRESARAISTLCRPSGTRRHGASIARNPASRRTHSTMSAPSAARPLRHRHDAVALLKRSSIGPRISVIPSPASLRRRGWGVRR
jgi:hypothetical protein